MSNEKELPNLGTPEEASKKMKESYLLFLDSCCKFITICDYYSKYENQGSALPSNFMDLYLANKKKLEKATADDIYDMLAFYAAFRLDYLAEVKENIEQYFEILSGNVDESGLSDYDKCCDRLAIRDGFVDFTNDFVDANREIAKSKEIDSLFNDPDYDPNCIQKI